MMTPVKRLGLFLEVALSVFPWVALVGVTLVGVSMLPFSDTNRLEASHPAVTAHGDEHRARAPLPCAGLATLANTDTSPDAGVAQVANCPPGPSAEVLPHLTSN